MTTLHYLKYVHTDSQYQLIINSVEKNIMKKNLLKQLSRVLMIIAVMLVGPLAFTGCDIDDNINNSPNAINESNVKSAVGVNGLMISLQVATADFYSGDRSRIAAMWTRQMCAPEGLGRPQPVSWNSYGMQTDGFVDDMWKIGYRGVRIANDIINFAPEVEFGAENDKLQNSYLGIAKTYKALLLGELAAFYGSIPTTIVGLEPPQFVSQADAYAEVQRLLESAATHFANSAAINSDLNFKGDGVVWTKVVHSLRARYYLHVKNYAEALNHARLGIDAASGTLLGIYNDAAGEYSPWGHWALTEVGEPIRVERTFMDLLHAEENDGRIAMYFQPNSEGNFVGFAFFNTEGASDEELDPTMSSRRLKYAAYADDFPLISFEENILIRAEAAARSGAPGEATNDLNAIRNAAGLGNYSGTDLVGEILLQKHLQLFLEGQNYTDMRRTGSLPSAQIPVRFIYPITEKNANPNVPPDNDNLMNAIL